MAERCAQNVSEQYIIPIFCGNTRLAHRLASRLFRRYGIVSLICGRARLWDFLDPATRTLRFPEPACDRLRIEELSALADLYADTLPVLIPCDADWERCLSENASLLESRFIFADPQSCLSGSPLSEICERFFA